MASKATVNRQKSAQQVAAAGRTHDKRIVGAMGEIFGADVQGAVELLLARSVERLLADTAAMVGADDAHEAELRDDPAARDERDEAALNLRGALVNARQQLGAVFGDSYLAALGFQGPTPVDPVEIHRLSRTVLDTLDTVAPPAPLMPGFTFEPPHYKGLLADHAGRLETALGAVADEARQAESTLSDKNKAIEKYDRSFSCTAKMLSALLETAGERDLARRVRPSARRRGESAEVAGDIAPVE